MTDMLPGTYGWKHVDVGTLESGMYFRKGDENGRMRAGKTFLVVQVKGRSGEAVVIERDANDEMYFIYDFLLPRTVFVPFLFGMFDDVYKGCWFDIGFDFVRTFK
jgi:hypothetical protein